jgi:hypothetical protein
MGWDNEEMGYSWMKSLIKGYGREKMLGYTSIENGGASPSHNPLCLHGLLQGQLYFMETECASCEVRTGL